jgi:aryl carrier-like protein
MDFRKQRLRLTLQLVGEGLDVVRATQWINDLRNAGLVRQNLLRA